VSVKWIRVAALILALVAVPGCAPVRAGNPAPKAETSASAGASTSATADPDIGASKAPDLPAPLLDAFIAKQYPQYVLVKRVSFPDQWDKGLLSVNYLLAAKHEPRFKILVSVAMLKTNKDAQAFVSTHYTQRIGRVLSDDGTFSVEAARLHPILTPGVLDSMVGAFISSSPKSDAMVYKSHVSGQDVEIRMASGTGGMAAAMQDDGSFGHEWGYFTIPRSGDKTAVIFTPGQ